MPVVATLSGRPAKTKQSQRSPRPGLILLGLGIVLLAFSGGFDASGSAANLDTLGGLLATIAGVVPRPAGHSPARADRPARAGRGAHRPARPRPATGPIRGGTRHDQHRRLHRVLIALLATNRYAEPLAYFGPDLRPMS